MKFRFSTRTRGDFGLGIYHTTWRTHRQVAVALFGWSLVLEFARRPSSERGADA